MIKQSEIRLPACSRGFYEITDVVAKSLGNLKCEGVVHLFLKHTSAGLMINENADRTVLSDFEKYLKNIVPEGHGLYSHSDEGEDDMPAHIKSALFGQSLIIPLTAGRLNLGTWQGIWLCEFRTRKMHRTLVLTVISND